MYLETIKNDHKRFPDDVCQAASAILQIGRKEAPDHGLRRISSRDGESVLFRTSGSTLRPCRCFSKVTSKKHRVVTERACMTVSQILEILLTKS